MPVHGKLLNWIGVALCATATVRPASAQNRPTSIEAGARVRFRLADHPDTWRRGEVDAVRNDSLVVFADNRVIAYPTSRIARLETPWRNKRGALVGAAVGAVVSAALIPSFATPGSSDLVAVAALGALIGAGVGSGRMARVSAGIGAALGTGLGAIVFGATGTACEGGTDRVCSMFAGGVTVGVMGLVVGTGVGMLLPNWVRVPLDGLEIGAAPAGGVQLGWSAGW